MWTMKVRDEPVQASLPQGDSAFSSSLVTTKFIPEPSILVFIHVFIYVLLKVAV